MNEVEVVARLTRREASERAALRKLSQNTKEKQMANSNMKVIGELVDGRTLSWDPEEEAYFAWVPENAEHVKVHLVDDEISAVTGTTELLGTPDPQVWAKAFVKQFPGAAERGDAVDEGTMIGWFANAMQAKETDLFSKMSDDAGDAEDEISRLRRLDKEQPIRFSTAELHELAFQIGGAAALPLLKMTGAVMPSEEVAREVNMILRSFDLPTLERDRAYHVLDPDEVTPDSLAAEARRRLREGVAQLRRIVDDEDKAQPLKMATGVVRAPDGVTINITLNAPHS